MREHIDPAFTPAFSTLNVGMIHGGKAKNVIPGACTFTLEWRPLPNQPTDLVLDELKRIAAELSLEEPGFEARIKPLRLDRGFSTPAQADVVQCLAKLGGKAPETVSFGTEAPQLAALGATPVVFGPGDITVAHQTGEHVPKDEFFRAAAILEQAIVQFCG
jgi:acetylornithine deacetylase